MTVAYLLHTVCGWDYRRCARAMNIDWRTVRTWCKHIEDGREESRPFDETLQKLEREMVNPHDTVPPHAG